MNTLLLGKYTEKEREDHINKVALEYMQRHPEARFSYARKRGRYSWSNLVHEKWKNKEKK